MIKKRFFKTKDECEITFELEARENKRVELVCQANGWIPVEMKRSRKGPFRTRLRFPKEREFEFLYRLDEHVWVTDEQADAYRSNGMGGENGVFHTMGGA